LLKVKSVSRLLLRALVLATLFGVGCQALMVREEEKPVADTVLMVSRGADETVLSWNSIRGARYMILYSDSRATGTRWQPLPNAASVVGTGSAITVRDAIPNTHARYYRLELVPASGRKR